MLVLYLAVAGPRLAMAQQGVRTAPPTAAAAAVAPAAGPIAQADELYKHREDMASAKRAVDLYAQAAATSFDAAWKLSRACYWIATAGPDKDRGNAREQGVKAGELAVKLDGAKPEGHFWLAANLGEVADHKFALFALSYPGRIKKELERVFDIDRAWQDGSADRALGEWYFRVPGVAGGDHKLAEEHLRASLTYNAKSIASLFFLAEVIADDSKRREEAKPLLQQVLAAPLDPDWGPEDRDFQAKAKALLAKITRK